MYDYLIINDNVEEASTKLRAIADRALAGLDPEPGQVPESVIIEDVSRLGCMLISALPVQEACSGTRNGGD